MYGSVTVTDATDLGDRCTANGIDLVRLLFVTPSGQPRIQAVAADEVEKAVDRGVPVSQLVQSYNAFGLRDKDGRFDAAGEARLHPDPRTFTALPYADGAAAMLCDVTTLDGEQWGVDARAALASKADEMADAGLAPTVAFESEFHLFDGDGADASPLDVRGAYVTESTRDSHDLVRAITDALDAQGIDVRKYYPEYAPGKHEVVVDHGPAVPAADEHVLLRETVSSVAANRDLQATFLPKPTEHATNGLHLHLSLWDGRDNRMAGPDGESLSALGRSFVAGVLDHAPALVALCAGTVNSYARLRPQLGAAAFVCWGYGNREALVRVPGHEPGDEGAVRIEFRAADNTANPYLALLGLLAAGTDGIDRDLTAPDPVAVDPGNLDADERAERGIERLPSSLGEALDALADDETIRAAVGEELCETYLEVKRSHWEAFLQSAESWQRERLRTVY